MATYTAFIHWPVDGTTSEVKFAARADLAMPELVYLAGRKVDGRVRHGWTVAAIVDEASYRVVLDRTVELGLT